MRVTPRRTLVVAGIRCAEGPDMKPTHEAAYWQHETRGFDFSDAGRVPAGLYNEVLWEGLMGGKPYPTQRVGLSPRMLPASR
jgi:hypothetical protein